MTAAILSQPRAHHGVSFPTIRTMAYAVVLRFDAAGVRPLIVGHDSDPLPEEDGVRYRLVAVTGVHEEAVGVADTLQRRIEAGELLNSGRA